MSGKLMLSWYNYGTVLVDSNQFFFSVLRDTALYRDLSTKTKTYKYGYRVQPVNGQTNDTVKVR